MANRPDLSVIVLTYNGRAWLDTCLRAVIEGIDRHRLAAEVILVDNASNDGTAEFVKGTFPSVRVLSLARNAGFTGGNNAGARIADGSLLAFLNNDTRVSSGWLHALANAFVAPDIGLATSRIVFLDRPDTIDSAGDGYTRAGGAFKRHHGGSASDPVATTAGEVFGACGAAFMIRRDLFDRLGGFDQDFFMVYEDVDLSYRARLAGFRCVYVPDAVVEHAGSATLGAQSDASVFHGQRNLEWAYVKNTPGGLLLRSFLSHVLYDIAGAAYFLRQGRFHAFARGKLAALIGLPRMLAKRRAIQRNRRVSAAQLLSVMDRNWIDIKRREKQTIAARASSVPR